MAQKPQTQPPVGLGKRGTAFWSAVLQDLEMEPHETALLAETCRVLDRLDLLDAEIQRSDLIVDGRVNPLFVEARLQGVTLARLIASLRLPDEYRAEVLDRGQRRGAARGTYKLKAIP